MKRGIPVSAILFTVVLHACGNISEFTRSNDETAPEQAPVALPIGLAPLPHVKIIEPEFQQRGPQDPIDILFSIDNSGSMDPHIARVEQNISVFTGRLSERNLRFRLGALQSTPSSMTGNFDPSLQGPFPIVDHDDEDPTEKIRLDIRHIRETNGNPEIAASIFRLFIASDEATSFYRPNSLAVFIPLSDARDELRESISFFDFLNLFNDFFGMGNWLMTAIGSPSTNPCPAAESQEQPLVEFLTRISGGTMGRICDTDYAAIMEDAVDRILSALSVFSIRPLVENPDWIFSNSLRVFVEDNEVMRDPLNGFSWDPSRSAVLFNGSAVPDSGQRIRLHVEVLQP